MEGEREGRIGVNEGKIRHWGDTKCGKRERGKIIGERNPGRKRGVNN